MRRPAHRIGGAVLLLFFRPPQFPFWAVALGLGLVALIWASTFFLQAPQHSALMLGFNAEAHRFLGASNWLRTVAWSGRGALLLWVVWRIL